MKNITKNTQTLKQPSVKRELTSLEIQNVSGGLNWTPFIQEGIRFILKATNKQNIDTTIHNWFYRHFK